MDAASVGQVAATVDQLIFGLVCLLLMAFFIFCLVGFLANCRFSRCGKTKHAWDGCICSVCKTRRNEEHSLSGCMCTRCGWIAPIGAAKHAWDGCICSVCKTRRATGHAWDGCICSLCKTIEASRHVWEPSYDSRTFSETLRCKTCHIPFDANDGNHVSSLAANGLELVREETHESYAEACGCGGAGCDVCHKGDPMIITRTKVTIRILQGSHVVCEEVLGDY
jgi:hypothetical protein